MTADYGHNAHAAQARVRKVEELRQLAVHAGATAAEIDDPAVRRDLLRALRMQRGKSVGASEETWTLLRAALHSPSSPPPATSDPFAGLPVPDDRPF